MFMRFDEAIELSPKVKLDKNIKYDFVEMADLDPLRKYVFSKQKKLLQGGSRFEHKDVLFARITPSLEHGKISQFISQNFKPAFGSTEFFVFRAKPNITDSDYVYYLCKTDFVRETAIKSMVGASGRQRARIEVIQELELNIPLIEEQRKIATILSNYDDLIENNIKRIELLEKTAKLIYDEWFVKFKFPGHEKVKMVDSEMGKIPEGWEVKKLGELFTIRTGKTDVKDAVEKGKYPLYDRSKIIKKSNKYLFDSKAIIVPGEGKEFVPRYYEGKFDLHQRAYAIMPKHNRKIMYFFLLVDKNKNYLARVATGATVKSLRMNDFESFPVLLPKEDILNKYENIVQSLFSNIVLLNVKNKNLQETRDLLLPKLINGVIDVSELDIKVSVVEA